MKNALIKIVVPALLLPSCLAYGGKANYKLFGLKEKEGASISSTFARYVEKDPRLSLREDSIRNVTPEAFPSSLGAELYRVGYWNETYLVHKDKVFHLGSGASGNGAYNFALANRGGACTLYYIYSYSHGLYYSSVAAYDFSSSKLRAIEFPEEQDFQGLFAQRDMQFVISEKGNLDLYSTKPDYEEKGEQTPEYLLQEDLGSLKLSDSAPEEIEPAKGHFLVGYDYGFHVKEKASELWSWYVPFFDPADYGQGHLVAGDQIDVMYLGDMYFAQSYPGQVMGRYYLVDVSFDLAEVVEMSAKEAKEWPKYNFGYGNQTKYVVNEDRSFFELDSLFEESIVYATLAKNADVICGLYSYNPR